MKVNFNEKWLFFDTHSENKPKEINLPHDAMLSEPRDENYKGSTYNAWFKGSDYTYIKTFNVPIEHLEKHIVFEFEGVYKDSEVWISNKLANKRPYGYTNFYVDADQYLLFGQKNEIKVLVHNSDQPNSRWYSGSGIYRPVNMYVLPKNHVLINEIKITTTDFEKGTIDLSVKTNGQGELSVKILDHDNVVFQSTELIDSFLSLSITIPKVKLWDEFQPNLYVCQIKYYDHIYEETFGVRSINIDSKNGLQINGKRVILKGACIHHDNGLIGAIAHPFSEDRKIRILKENGYNAIRSSHNPCSKALLNACDKYGMYVLDEYVDMWYVHKTKYDYANHLEKWWKQDLFDMVNKDYNHPSVIMYSIGNEVGESSEKKGIELSNEMVNYLKELDNRPVTCGINIFFNLLYSMGFGVYSDKKSEKGVKVGSEFFNYLAGKFGDKTMKLGATLYGCDRKTKGVFSNLDIAGYNYGILRYKKDIKKYPNRIILGTETFGKDATLFWDFAKENPQLIGDFVWAGFDYLGEVGIGAWEYPEYAPENDYGVGWITAGSGKFDITGKPTSEVNYAKVAFEIDNIKLAVVPVNNTFTKHSPSAWRMTNALESWSWEGYENETAIVEVYARANKVELFINEESQGTKKIDKRCKTKFKVKYKSGTLLARSYDKSGNIIGTTQLHTASSETKLSLQPENLKITKNDLSYIRLAYTDNNGVVKPLTRGDIKVQVTNGKLLGLGNACSYSKNGYLTDSTDTYYGEALAIIEPLESGELIVTASSKHGNDSCLITIID